MTEAFPTSEAPEAREAPEAYERMRSGKARFRVILDMSAGGPAVLLAERVRSEGRA